MDQATHVLGRIPGSGVAEVSRRNPINMIIAKAHHLHRPQSDNLKLFYATMFQKHQFTTNLLSLTLCNNKYITSEIPRITLVLPLIHNHSTHGMYPKLSLYFLLLFT
jgi:hypothetical protein